MGGRGIFLYMLGKCIDLKGDWRQGKMLVSHLREVHNIVGERSEKMMSKGTDKTKLCRRKAFDGNNGGLTSYG